MPELRPNPSADVRAPKKRIVVVLLVLGLPGLARSADEHEPTPNPEEREAVGTSASDAEPPINCDDAFPSYADGRQVADFGLYGALVANDLITFIGGQEDTPAAKRLADVDDKPYQLQKLKRAFLRDKAFKASFRSCRDQVSKVRLYYLPDDDTGRAGSLKPRFIAGEFRFITDCGLASSDKVALMTVRGSGTSVQLDGTVINDDVSSARSPRARCWTDDDDPFERCCGLSLKGMPGAIKDVIEDEFGKSITVRWRWKGFGSPARGALGAVGGDLWFGAYRMTVRAPSDMELQFIDSDGGVIWVAK